MVGVGSRSSHAHTNHVADGVAHESFSLFGEYTDGSPRRSCDGFGDVRLFSSAAAVKAQKLNNLLLLLLSTNFTTGYC